MSRVTTYRRLQGFLAGAMLGLLAAVHPAHASVETEERAAVFQLLTDRGQTAIAAGIPHATQSEQSEPTRLLAQPLTADAAVRVALLHHPGVRAALTALGIPRGQLLTASLPPNPEVEVSLRAPQDTAQPIQAEMGVDYDLAPLFLLPLRRSVAQTGLQTERLRAASEILEIAYRARLAFWEASAAEEQLALRSRAFEVAEAAYAVREELVRVGNAPALELAQEKAAMESARLDVTEAQLRAQKTQAQLHAALGLHGTQTKWSIAKDALSVPDAGVGADPEQRAIDANLDLAMLRNQASTADQRARLARAAGILPHLDVGFHGEHDGRSWELGGHLAVGIPLVNQGQGHVAAARAEYRSTNERLSAAQMTLRARVRAAQAQLSLQVLRAQILRDGIIPARERALRELQLQYNGMQVSVFQLLDSRRLLFDAQSSYIDARRQAQQARAAVDLLLAGYSAEVGNATSSVATGTSATATDSH